MEGFDAKVDFLASLAPLKPLRPEVVRKLAPCFQVRHFGGCDHCCDVPYIHAPVGLEEVRQVTTYCQVWLWVWVCGEWALWPAKSAKA